MSTRTIIEINHEIFHHVSEDEGLRSALTHALRGDDDAWDYLEQRGIRKIVERRHSDAGFIQFKHSQVRLP